METTDYTGNALAITDTEVASDWRLGLVRALATVALGAAPDDSTGPYGVTIPGSNREHVIGNFGPSKPGCPLVEIYDVKDTGGSRYNFSTFGGSSDEIILLTANATCKCGQIVKHPVSMEITPSDLIYSVLNA